MVLPVPAPPVKVTRYISSSIRSSYAICCSLFLGINPHAFSVECFSGIILPLLNLAIAVCVLLSRLLINKNSFGKSLISSDLKTSPPSYIRLISADESINSLQPLSVSYTHLRAHETRHDLVCRL